MDLLPIATTSATQTIFVSTTGIEKIFTLIGIATIVLLALIGILSILWIVVRAMRSSSTKK